MSPVQSTSSEQCLLVLKLFMSLHKHRLVLEKKEALLLLLVLICKAGESEKHNLGKILEKTRIKEIE